MTNRRRNEGISLLRLVCSILVVFMHVRFPGIYGKILPAACRFPVPVFFMISGYYSVKKDAAWMWRKALYILKLLVICELCYFLLNGVLDVLRGNSFLTTIQHMQENKRWWLLPFSGTLCCGPLWYLYAMFWTWILAIAIRKGFRANYQTATVVISADLLAAALILRLLYGGEENIDFFRTGLMYGLPFFGLGTAVYCMQERNRALLTDRRAFIIGGIGAAIMVGEYITFRTIADFRLSTVFISVSLFVLALNHPSFPRLKLPVRIGENAAVHICFARRISFDCGLLFRALWPEQRCLVRLDTASPRIRARGPVYDDGYPHQIKNSGRGRIMHCPAATTPRGCTVKTAEKELL